MELALGIEQGCDLEVVAWWYLLVLILILVVVVGLALLMIERWFRGERWHLEVRWWWELSRD